ncbi:putative nucleotide-diphospho-sugar transferase [Methylobacterium komagatae]|uniref:Nucleotide-diphospho-sugar transferase n=1 Tax=Methylobacterium komagatae TaxID=374425 RepID=A0ABW2BQD5_9HYPH
MNKLRRAIFTLTTNQKLPWACLLFETLRTHNPECDLILGLVDRAHDGSYPEGCKIISVEDIRLPDEKSFLFRYSAFNLCTAVKPYYFKYLFEMGYEKVLYFDSDIAVFQTLDRYFGLMEAGSDFILTPHLLKPTVKSDLPDDIAILRHGTFNLGFIGIAASAESIPLVDWWAEKLQFNCVTLIEEGVFADQKFIDLIPSFTSKISIVRDPGANFAYWNMLRRVVSFEDERFYIDSLPLIFAHFSGFDIHDLGHLSKYGARVEPEETRGLEALILWYADKLRSFSADSYVPAPYAFGSFYSGAAIPDGTREKFRQSVYDPNEDPFACSALEDGSYAFVQRQPPVIKQSTRFEETHDHLLVALRELDTRTHHAFSLLQENETLKARIRELEGQGVTENVQGPSHRPPTH